MAYWRYYYILLGIDSNKINTILTDNNLTIGGNMNRIESKKNMLHWAQDVNQVCKPGKMSDLQDVFARSTAIHLKDYFIDTTQNEKELLIFSISKAMGSCTLFEFVKSYAHHSAQQFIESESAENDKRWMAIVKKEREFETTKQGYTARIEKLTKQLNDVKNDNHTMSKAVSGQWNEIRNKEVELEELSEENTRLMAFEAHVKTLLAPK